MKDIALVAMQLAPSRFGGRTAIVATSDFTFGLGRMYEAFAEFTDLGFELKIFRSRNEAEIWLANSAKE